MCGSNWVTTSTFSSRLRATKDKDSVLARIYVEGACYITIFPSFHTLDFSPGNELYSSHTGMQILLRLDLTRY